MIGFLEIFQAQQIAERNGREGVGELLPISLPRRVVAARTNHKKLDSSLDGSTINFLEV